MTKMTDRYCKPLHFKCLRTSLKYFVNCVAEYVDGLRLFNETRPTVTVHGQKNVMLPVISTCISLRSQCSPSSAHYRSSHRKRTERT